MKTESDIKNKIDLLNLEWNKTFLAHRAATDEDVKEILGKKCFRAMTEILILKWVLEYNYLAPEHTLGYENQQQVEEDGGDLQELQPDKTST